jgi:hypothetical protein
MKKRQNARKAIPRFENEDQERDFWARHDVVDYFDWNKAVKAVDRRPAPRHTCPASKISHPR